MRLRYAAPLFVMLMVCSLHGQQPTPPANGTAPAAAPPANGGAPAAAKREAQGIASPFTLSEADQKRLDQLLTHWERRSSAVKTYSCTFQRFEYDMVFGPEDPNVHKTQAEGIIRYSAPDKGEFNVTRLGKNPDFKMEAVSHVEHWICDGNSVFELNPQKQQLIEQKLPESMKGQQIADGPLPFMFGAKKDKLIARYWIREIKPPENRPNEYWIEAFPRTRADAVNFAMVRVILDQKTFLPNALQVFPPNYHPKNNPSRMS
ncbi:MAG: TIGR03009 domain-containing protein, partial [Planctomycetota bacterium]